MTSRALNDRAPAVADFRVVEGRTRTLWLLALALVLSMTAWFSASAIVPQLRDLWGMSDATAAWLTIAVQLGFVAGALASSVVNLSDIVSPRAVIAGGAAGAAGVNLLLLAAGGSGGGIALRFATGFFLAGVYPPAVKLLSTWYQQGRGIALGILVGALTLGTALPHLINGLGGLDVPTVIVGTSALTFAGGVVVVAAVREGPYPFPRATFDPRQAREVWRNRGVRLTSLGYFGHMWELYAMWAWFLVFFREQQEASGAGSAFVAFSVIGVGALGCWAGGHLAERWGRTRTTALSMVISGSCALVIGVLSTGPAWVLVLVGLLWGFTVVADSAQFSTIVTEVGNQEYVGTALTLQLALGFTLTVATIWLIPVMRDAFGWAWAFVLLAPGPALGTAAMLRLKSLPEAQQIAGGLG